MAVVCFEVSAQPAQTHPQRLRREVRATDIRTDQKPAEPGHQAQVPGPALVVPAYPVVPRLQLERRGRKPGRAEPAVHRADQVADLAAGVERGATGMLPGHEFVPDPPVKTILHEHQNQALDQVGAAGNLLWQRNRMTETDRMAAQAATPPGRKRDPARPFERAECGIATGHTQSAAGVAEAEFLADATSGCCAAEKRLRGEYTPQPGRVPGEFKRGTDRVKRVHDAETTRAAASRPVKSCVE